MKRNILLNFPKEYSVLTRFAGFLNDVKHKGPGLSVFKANFILYPFYYVCSDSPSVSLKIGFCYHFNLWFAISLYKMSLFSVQPGRNTNSHISAMQCLSLCCGSFQSKLTVFEQIPTFDAPEVLISLFSS